MPYFFYPLITLLLLSFVFIVFKTKKIKFLENQAKNKKNIELLLIGFMVGIFLIGILTPTITGCDAFGGMLRTGKPPAVFCTRNGIFSNEINYMISFWAMRAVSLLIIFLLIYKAKKQNT